MPLAKQTSPLVGYNNNVRHRGRVFHVQTEDSGLKHPHVITHLFADGGRILKSVKRAYAEHVEAPDVRDIVRQLMKDQHKAMLIALRDGQFDALFEDAPASASPVPPTVAALPAPPAAAPAPLAPPPPRSAAAPSVAPAPPTTREPTLETLERAAGDRSAARVTPGEASPLPPPARTAGKEPGTGTYRSVPPREGPASDVAPAPPTVASPRYAATRPASVFEGRPPARAALFSPDVAEDRSLDEAILSYLADELDRR